ncbi:ParB/RepB/Spo0J family partition protein [Roseospira visakhapatnamensis]|uniref:ParB family chromosome partitioning protein n=1 Tax=Roseospira visakhapatnamensis TaxID=390880 RepID=A0A7W6RFY7_9PROT|nr:ParB/RepB/Spo0J family partition protein [Roseospira visakhapatnamensis]MBB4267849.1 ParB family chromosome partitioning protein [Roseospira visakhapatnamensis]
MTSASRKSASRKVTLNGTRDIPFDKLILSQANVRRVKDSVSIEDLADDIARRGLLQSLTVRPIRQEDGTETGTFEVPVGGRRYRALERLVTQKRMTKTAPVPCIVHDDGLAEEDSLAENVQRVALHPLDQFRAFQVMREAGLSEEDIAARFFITPTVVRQRLRLASVSPRLLDLYAEGTLVLEQLMAFAVTPDHDRQEQVWEALSQGSHRPPHVIRRMLTETAVRAGDRRARFVGIEAYEAAGGLVLRDLFTEDNGGWLQDVGLLERLVAERLTTIAEEVRAEGWRWVEAAVDFPYGHTNGLRRLPRETAPLTEAEQAERDALVAEMDALLAGYPEPNELPEDVDARVGEIEAALKALENRPATFEPDEVARAGVFVSIDLDGEARIERGFVRPEDEPPAPAPEAEPDGQAPATPDGTEGAPLPTGAMPEANAPDATQLADPDPDPVDEPLRPLPDRLVTELTAHRTLALRDALASHPETAFLAVLHALCLSTFHRHAAASCLDITGRSGPLGAQAPGLKDSVSAQSLDARQDAWIDRLPADPRDVWGALQALSTDERMDLLAHCASRTVNAVVEPWNRVPGRTDHADALARAVGLDMVAAGWRPTVETYLGRVPKARILAAVREAVGDKAADRLVSLRKGEMATEAEALLAETGWLPEPLRTPEVDESAIPETPDTVSEEPEAGAADADIGALETPLEEFDTGSVPEDIDDATRAAE